MGRFLVHGLVVETSSSLGWDPGAELLAGFRASEAAVGLAPDLLIDVGVGESPVPDGESDVVLAQEGASVLQSRDALRVEVPGVSVSVPIAGGRVEARVAEGPTDRRTLAQVPLLLGLAAALRLRGWYHLHAGCTVSPGGEVVLVVGHAGSGKSTLCTALLAAGHRYLGDDVLFVDGATGRLLGFPRPFHLGPETAAAFPELARHLGDRYGRGPKRLLDAAMAFPERALGSAGPPTVLLFPHVAPGQATTTWTALSPAEAVGRLLESSAFAGARLPGHREQVAALAALAENGSRWSVEVGLDVRDAAPRLSRDGQ